jgi:hypothetical protein
MSFISKFLALCYIFLLVGSMSFLYAEEPSSKGESSVKIVKIGNSADGVGITMGVYSPFHEEMKGVYGGAFTLSGQYSLNMSLSTDLLGSVGFIRKEGNPYYDDPSFTSGDHSKISIIPIEISIRKRFSLMKYPPRGLFIGAGMNYMRVSEKMPNIVSSTGGDFGTHIFVGPQLFLRDGLAFEGEIKLLMNEVDMKSGNLRYPVTLSGLIIKAGLMWYY